jgi:hypothetical protein
MTTFNYTEDDLQAPIGDNGLSSYALFFQRMLYKELIFPSSLVAPLDTWYGKQLYGLVDQSQNIVTPGLANLRAIPTAVTRNLLALNFVVEAFEDFAAHMRKGVIMGVLRKDGNILLTDMKAKRAYVDPTNIHRQYLQQVYSGFIKSRKQDQLNQISTFEAFLPQMMQYLRTMSKTVPVTKSGFMVSGICSVVNSGLTISIDNGPAGDDAYKYQQFINDPNFSFYLRAAKKFGLSVNKNMPWMLTADLFSDAILKYLNTYILPNGSLIGKTNFFETYYDPVCLVDVGIIKTFIINSYKNFVESHPLYEIEKYSPRCNTTTVQTKYRTQIPNNASDLITDKQLLYLYLDMRNNESKGARPPTPKIKREIQNVYSLRPDQSITSTQNASEYISLLYRDFIYEPSYLFTLDIFSQLGLDNQARTGTISTAGAVTQQLY